MAATLLVSLDYSVEGRDLANHYASIDVMLTFMTESEVIETNLQAADALYETFLSQGLDPESNKMKAFKLFMDLEKVLKDKCSASSAEIITQNHKVIKHNSQTSQEKANLSRVTEVVKQVAIKRAKECQQQRFKNFQIKLSSSSGELLDRVENLFTGFAPNDSSEDVYKFIKSHKLDSFTKPNDCKFLHEKLKNLVSEPNLKYLSPPPERNMAQFILGKLRYANLFDHYISNPCAKFTSSFREIFEEEAFDSQWYDVVGKDELEYYKFWSEYELCKRVLDKKEEILRCINV